jgi:hypothetical protein
MDPEQTIEMLAIFATAVMESTKRQCGGGVATRAIKAEYDAARQLLTLLLSRKPSEEEINRIIPG